MVFFVTGRFTFIFHFLSCFRGTILFPPPPSQPPNLPSPSTHLSTRTRSLIRNGDLLCILLFWSSRSPPCLRPNEQHEFERYGLFGFFITPFTRPVKHLLARLNTTILGRRPRRQRHRRQRDHTDTPAHCDRLSHAVRRHPPQPPLLTQLQYWHRHRQHQLWRRAHCLPQPQQLSLRAARLRHAAHK